MAYLFNGVTKRITEDTAPVGGEKSIDAKEMYSAWKDWVLTGDNTKYLHAFRYSGYDDIGNDQSTGLHIFLVNGWRFLTYSADHTCYVSGNLRVSRVVGEDVGGSPYVHPAEYSVHVETAFSAESLVNRVSTGSGLSTDEHNRLLAIPTTDNSTKIDELHAIAGLDAARPMTVTPTARSAGSVALKIEGDGITSTTVTRQ